jgi:hypothetical protein
VKKWQLDQHIAKTPIDHPDLSVTRAKLEYPTVDVSLWYLLIIGKATVSVTEDITYAGFVTVDSFADLAVGDVFHECSNARAFAARWSDWANTYFNTLYAGATTADHVLKKVVAGTETTLATEAVDIISSAWYLLRIQCRGTTISSKRSATTISATDTSFSSGKFGVNLLGHYYSDYDRTSWAFLRAVASPMPQPIAYFEVPIIGDGSEENPFRAKMPELIVEDAKLGKRNLLALTHSALIPTDAKTGKPIHGTALIRVFEQPERDLQLYPITKCLDSLKAMSGVSKLTRETAIKRAMQMDDKLHIADLLPQPKQTVHEYVDWREKTLGVKRELISVKQMETYVQSDKGW